MLPSSIRTFWSLTHAPSTPLSVLVARATASLMASSKPVSEVALNSVTRATLIGISASLNLACSLSNYMWPYWEDAKHKGRDTPKDIPVRPDAKRYLLRLGCPPPLE